MCGFVCIRRLTLICLLSSAGASAQSVLSVDPRQVSLAAPAGSTAPVVRTVAVFSSPANLAFTASVRYLGAATGWLSVGPTTGTTAATLTISADPTKVGPGTYLGQVTITAGALGTVVDVFFSVETGAGGGAFLASPTNLSFRGQPGQSTLASQPLTVTSQAGGSAAFDAFASSAGNWLTVLPTSGTTPATLTVGATQQNLAAGTYTGTITITPRMGGGNPTIVPVTLVAAGSESGARALRLSPPSLIVNHQIRMGASDPPLQEVELTAGGETVSYTATTTTSWLRLQTDTNPVPATFISGFTPGNFSVRIDPAGLPVGSHSGIIAVSSPEIPPVDLAVTLRISTTPALNASPSSVLFDHISGSDLPSPVQVMVTTTGSSAVPFTVSSTEFWLQATPATGTTGGNPISISVSPNSLNAGTYTGSIVVTPQNGASLTIPVTLNVTGSSGQGEIEVSAESIELTGLVGGTAPSQTILVTSSEFATQHDFNASASSSEGWLIVSPITGRTPTNLRVSVNAARVRGEGTYQGSIVITSLLTGSEKTIPITLTLAQRAIVAEPGSLSFSEEQRGVSPPPQTIAITANAPSSFSISTLPRWLRANPMAGATPANVSVWVDVTAVPPGTTGDTIIVTGPNNEVNIPVSVMLLPPPMPTATPDAITFTYQLGSPPPAPQTIRVGSTAEPVQFTASATTQSATGQSGGRWLTISPTSGTGSATTPASIAVSIDTATLVPGRQTGSIVIAVANNPGRTVTVPVTVNVTQAPLTLQRVLHAAILAPTPVAPGQMVTIDGTGLGPSPGVAARPSAAGAMETRLEDVRVLFDGVPAPMLYASADQVNAIVPYAVHGRVSTRVQVERGTSFSIPVELRVVDSAPGIFVTGTLGRGQAAAINADQTSNSLANPAPRGSVITIFGTGEGQTDPQGQDGRIISTDLRRPLLPVTVRIGGRPAEVIYAGSASSMVSGVFQANVRIPADVEAGTVAIELQVGSATSQPGVTIAIR